MANFNFNKVLLGGRLTADPELRQTANGIPVASFTVAVSRKISRAREQQPQGASAQPTADFFNCVAWRAQAEFVTRYFKKASSIFVIGTVQNRTWVDQQNQKHYATDIIVDEVNFVDSKGDNMTGDSAQYQSAPPTSQYAPPSYSSDSDEAAKFSEDLQNNDDDLPF